VLLGTFDRPNLCYRVVPRTDRITQTLTTLGRAPDFWGTNNPMRGYLGEVLIYARALSDAEITAANTYLRARWVP
jgi:hypothetical protein